MPTLRKEHSNSKQKPILITLALALFAVLLVVALAVIVPLMHSNPNHQGTAEASATPTGKHHTAGLYLGTAQGILQLDANTGASLKSYSWPHTPPFTSGTVEPYMFQAKGNMLYVGLNIRKPDGFLASTAIEALDLNTGAIRWVYSAPTTFGSAMTVANDTVYLSADNPADTTTLRSFVFALRATDGRLLATYPVPDTATQLTIANGFLYEQTRGNFYALELASGKIWSKLNTLGAEQGFWASQVTNGAVYTSLYQGQNSQIMVFHPQSGALIWQSQKIPGKVLNFAVVDNVMYFGTDAPLPGSAITSGAEVGRLVAYGIQQQKVLWEQPTDLVAQSYTVANGVVYAVISAAHAGQGIPAELIALRTEDGKLLWKATAGSENWPYQPLAPVISNGHLYVAAETDPRFPGTQLDMFSPTSGQLIWQQHFAARIWAFTLVTG